ncbi:MAG: HAD-IA family hydrolase [Chthoniobacterales bacterium]
MIRVVTFDAGNTLISLRKPPGLTYAEVGRRFGYRLDPERLECAFRRAWRESPTPLDQNGPRPDDGRGWWRQLVARMLSCAGYEIRDPDWYFEAVYREFGLPGAWELRPGAKALLEELYRLGLRLGIVSNFDRRLYGVLDDLGIRGYFEQVVISSEVGADKPSPRIFQVALDRFQVQPEEMVHVGDDDATDGAGACAAGIPALIVENAEHTLDQVVERIRRFG